MAQPHEKPISVQDYFASEEMSPVKREYFYGYVYAQAGTPARHNRICLNVVQTLEPASQRKNCFLYMSDMKFMPVSQVIYYPDVLLSCEPLGQQLCLTVACLVVEVLSPSTRNVDFRDKLAMYQQNPHVHTYLIIETDLKMVYAYQRANQWMEQRYSAGEVPIPCLDAVLPVEAIYERIPFDA